MSVTASRFPQCPTVSSNFHYKRSCYRITPKVLVFHEAFGLYCTVKTMGRITFWMMKFTGFNCMLAVLSAFRDLCYKSRSGQGGQSFPHRMLACVNTQLNNGIMDSPCLCRCGKRSICGNSVRSHASLSVSRDGASGRDPVKCKILGNFEHVPIHCRNCP